MLKTEKNIVLFTPGKRIKACKEKLQGKKILFKGKKNYSSELTMNCRGYTEKKVVFPFRDGQPPGTEIAENVI